MYKFNDDKGQLKCSFCGKSQEQVRKLVAGPGVYICDECIESLYGNCGGRIKYRRGNGSEGSA